MTRRGRGGSKKVHHVGYSQLKAFITCPLFHHWRYREKRDEPMSQERRLRIEHGSLLQRVVETFYREQGWRAANPLGTLDAIVDRCAATLPAGYSRLAGFVRVDLPNLLQTMRRESLVGPAAAVEERVSLVVAGVSIEGRVDVVLRGLDGRVTLLDGKRGSTVDTRQLKVYACALRETVWGFPNRLGTWSYGKASVQWLGFTSAKVPAFLAQLGTAVTAFVQGSQAARPGSHCSLCGFRRECTAYAQRVRTKQALAPAPSADGLVSLEDT